jgi:hypothetical protein
MTATGEPGAWGPEQERYFREVRLGEPRRLDGPVLLADYDPAWPGLYQREAARIRSGLCDRVLLLEHVGSTAVPGLAARPSSTSCSWSRTPPTRMPTSRTWSRPATGCGSGSPDWQ